MKSPIGSEDVLTEILDAGIEMDVSEFQKDYTAEGILATLGGFDGLDDPIGGGVLDDLPTIRPESEFQKYYKALGIQQGIGGSGNENFQAFLAFNAELAKVFGPLFGQYLAGKQQQAGIDAIMKADDQDKIRAIQAVMSANALSSRGYSSGMQQSTLVGLQATVNNLPADQRKGLMDAAFQELLANTSDPAMRQALLEAYENMSKTWWDTWKWPILIGSTAAGIAVVVVAVKRKELLMEEGRLGVRA